MQKINEPPAVNDGEVVYLVYTDVVDSTKLDRESDPIKWRKDAFGGQLTDLLSLENSLVLKSIGDALFVIYEVNANERSQVKNTSKKILYCIWKAFASTKEVSIRAVVHRITGHKRGGEIANHLQTITTSGKKEALVETLKKDIFGTEVNRAARILSLVHNPAILVSQDIVREIDSQAHNKAIRGESISFTYNSELLTLHSPVPVLYMKGVQEENQKPYVVWEMGQQEEPTLAPEFKLNQSFRLIVIRLGIPVDPVQKGQEIADQTLTALSLLSPDLKLRFYNDILWKVSDYFILRNPSFERYDRAINRSDYAKSLTCLTSRKPRKDKFQIEGQTKILEISVKKTGIANITASRAAPNKEFFIPVLAFTSFPDSAHKDQTRELLSRETPVNQITQIEPQSIEVYKSIRFSDEFLKTLNDDPESSDFKGFADKVCILLLFQVYFGSLQEAVSEELFGRVEDIRSCVCYGLTTGMSDGFVLYSTQQKWEQELKSILEKLISVADADNFYYKICPIAVFILEPVPQFPPLKRNIQYLKKVAAWNK